MALRTTLIAVACGTVAGLLVLCPDPWRWALTTAALWLVCAQALRSKDRLADALAAATDARKSYAHSQALLDQTQQDRNRQTSLLGQRDYRLRATEEAGKIEQDRLRAEIERLEALVAKALAYGGALTPQDLDGADERNAKLLASLVR